MILQAVQRLAEKQHLRHGPFPEKDSVQFRNRQLLRHQFTHQVETVGICRCEGKVPRIRTDTRIEADSQVRVQFDIQFVQHFADQQTGRRRISVHPVCFHKQRVRRMVIDLSGMSALFDQTGAAPKAFRIADVNGEHQVEGTFVFPGYAYFMYARQEGQRVRNLAVAE